MRMLLLRLLFLVGIAIMAYPYVANAIYQSRANTDMAALDEVVAEGNHEEYAQELESARAYNGRLVGETVPDVFAIREGVSDETYESFLNVAGDEMMGTIEIPVIRVHLPIYHYSTEESLIRGCGHIFGSSLPVGGMDSHTVITAHRGLASAKLFTDLDQLVVGDRFYITVLDEHLAYEITGVEVVEPHETRSLAIRRGQDLATLVTCTPYGVNTQRLLVHGTRVPYEGRQEIETTLPHATYVFSTASQVAAIVAGAVFAIGLRRIIEFIRRKRSGEDVGQ